MEENQTWTKVGNENQLQDVKIHNGNNKGKSNKMEDVELEMTH